VEGRASPRHLFYAARLLDAWKPTHRGVFVLLAPAVGTWYPCSVRIFSRSTLVQLWRKHRDAEPALRLWFSQVEKAAWNGPADVRAMFGTADFIADNRIVFDIKSNTYRLIVKVRYAPLYLVFIRFVGTHAEYDRVDAATV
jgi:mRNA interferase HigB